MKYLNLVACALFVLLAVSCGKDEHNHGDDTDFKYHAHIHSPNTDTRKVGDKLPIKVEFESHAGKTVHHINVKIYQADDESVVIFNEPSNAHVHATSGKYTFEKTITLSESIGVKGHKDYTLKASVWGHDDKKSLVEEKVTFHVHPK